MRNEAGTWILSPRDLIAELECNHRLNLEWSAMTGLIEKPKEENSKELELLINNGRAHEQRLVEKYRALGSFKTIGDPSQSMQAIETAKAATLQAIHDEVEVIHQATLFTGDFLGFADFLILVKDDSGKTKRDSENRPIYEPVDAKSARIAKRAAVLQVASYALAMVRMGLAMPPKIHLWLAGDTEWSNPTSDLIDLAEEFENRARSRITSFTDIASPRWAPPREACIRCRWQEHCANGRIEDRDLSLIYGIRSTTRSALVEGGIKTIDAMSKATEDDRKSLNKDVSKETFHRLREQAALQIKGEGNETPIFEVKDPSLLALIPASSEGDVWFDMEGDPYSNDGQGLEYMFGYLYQNGNQNLTFTTFDAESKLEEKKAFTDFVTFIVERRKTYPDMHVYHYAAYEPSALLRLAQRYGTLENEVDILKKQGVFVDLLSIVRKTLRFSTDSLSIKSIEKVFYPGHRNDDVATAIESVIAFQDATLDLANGDRASFEKKVADIRKYNEVDCRSLHALDQWLRTQADEHGIELTPRFAAEEEAEDDKTDEEIQLLSNVHPDPLQRDQESHGAALLASSIQYHKRESKPVWWNIFDKADKDIDELEGFDDVILIDEVTKSTWDKTSGQRVIHRTLKLSCTQNGDLRYLFDVGEYPHLLYDLPHPNRLEVAGSPRSLKSTKILDVDEDTIHFDETSKQMAETWEETPIAILPTAPVKTETISSVLRQELAAASLARRSSSGSLFTHNAWTDILLRRPPRQKTGSLPHTTEKIDDITNALLDSDNSYIAVQGPPGTGKTHLGAHVIAELIGQHNWRIGVVAQSHAVIENLLNAVQRVNSAIPIAKSCKSQPLPSYHQAEVPTWARQQTSGYLIGGTAWTFAKSEIRDLKLDLIVVDEAGQFSLANTIASISSARTALLLGDPQQLPQVSQGTHPEPVNESALQHLLGTAKTISDEMGYFLDTTFRLHPLLAKPVSRLQYEDRLHSDPRCSKRNLQGVDPGLHIVTMVHEGNTTKSIEEGLEISAHIKEILGKSWIDTDKNGQPLPPRPLTESDILVVTAYNAQVKYLKSLMNKNGWHSIRVGTFDKFQGQEAPIVFVSMATSTAEDLPRGIEFLLSPNRINVAVSRAQWACFLYRSTQLSFMEPTTPEGMVMLGKFVTLCKPLN